MFKRLHIGTVALSTLALLAIMLVVVHDRALSQEKPADQKAPAAKPLTAKPEATAPAAAKPRKAAAKPRKKPGGRLPAYYNEVVDQQQREKIYAIQQECKPQIDALKAQLAALMKERDEKIAAVLTPEQKKKVEQLRQEAKARRATKGKKPAAKAKRKSAPAK